MLRVALARIPGRSGLTIALVIGVCAAALPVSAAAGRAHCGGTVVLAKSREAVVLTLDSRYGNELKRRVKVYGCLRSTAKRVLLNETGPYGRDGVDPSSIRLAGDFVSYVEQRGRDTDPVEPVNRVVVRNLRTGKLVHKARLTSEGDEFDYATAYVLKRSGSLAWIAYYTHYSTNPDDKAGVEDYLVGEVWSVTRGTRIAPAPDALDAPNALDSGREIGRTLRLSSNRRFVAWVSAGHTRRARLP